ncbi:CPBP family intramembrane glutamic endopeptidase [Chryseobacterium oryctis]|uniref:CPBP family intramembrane glutamic endopeptidase n=1 Tax=Chryseobacterium oryctis TaxID=2952618 RepID=UPI003872E34D
MNQLKKYFPILSFFIVFALLKFTPLNTTEVKPSNVIIIVFIYVIGFLSTLFVTKDWIKNQWKEFKTHKWTKYLWILLFYILSFVIISLTRKLILNYFDVDVPEDASSKTQTFTFYSFIAIILPMLAPFYEEIAFRYSLFYQNINRKFSNIIFAVISSVLFGLIHYYNFNSVVLTIPYMFIGLFYCFVYYKTRNIYYTIFTHLLVNWINVILGIIGLVFLNMQH